MRNQRVYTSLAFVLTTVLVMSLALTSGASAHGDWPFVKPLIAASISGDLITYSVMLRNQSTHTRNAIDLRVKIPEGTTLVDSWAGNPYTNRAIYDGTSVGWYQPSVAAEANQGPFVVTVKVDPWVDGSKSRLSSWAWVRWFGGDATSDTVTLPNPLRPGLAFAVASRGSHSSRTHASYLDVAANINDLRTQVANWEKGNDSGRRIAIEKIDRLDALIPHVAWPEDLEGTIDELEHALAPVEEALKSQDLAAATKALAKISTLSHDLTHDFYDDWAVSIKGASEHASIHTGYLDVSGNIADLRSQVANWKKGNDSGRRIAVEKIDRLEALLPHTAWPTQMAATMNKLYVALAPVKSGLKAENLEVAKRDLATIATLSHDLTHDFYDKWVSGAKSVDGIGVAHAAYLDVSANINDLRSQVATWEQGNDSGRRIATEKVDRLEALIPHPAWPNEMKESIHELEDALEPVAAALKAQDVAATQQVLAKVATISHDLTHAFYDKWVTGQRVGHGETGSPGMMNGQPAATAMPTMPAGASMPAQPPALSSELVTRGRQVFTSQGCAACHGATGQGGVGPSLTHWHDADTIKSVVRNGEGGMPSFSVAQLGDDALSALIAFVQSLASR